MVFTTVPPFVRLFFHEAKKERARYERFARVLNPIKLTLVARASERERERERSTSLHQFHPCSPRLFASWKRRKAATRHEITFLTFLRRFSSLLLASFLLFSFQTENNLNDCPGSFQLFPIPICCFARVKRGEKSVKCVIHE